MLSSLSSLFGASESQPLSSSQLQQLQAGAWAGDMTGSEEAMRPICWRIFLGIISNKGQNAWANELSNQHQAYLALKKVIFPKVSSEVKVDPLSALLGETSAEKSPEWEEYYKVRFDLNVFNYTL